MISGIVLKSYLPNKAKLTVLSDAGERFDLPSIKSSLIARMHPGYRVCLKTEDHRGIIKISQVELLAVPAGRWEKLSLLQQVIKLSVWGIAVGAAMPAASNLLNFILNQDTIDWTESRRRLLVCHLLGAMGFIPELAKTNSKQIIRMYQIGQLPLEVLQVVVIDHEIEQLLIGWINQIDSDWMGSLSVTSMVTV